MRTTLHVYLRSPVWKRTFWNTVDRHDMNSSLCSHVNHSFRRNERPVLLSPRIGVAALGQWTHRNKLTPLTNGQRRGVAWNEFDVMCQCPVDEKSLVRENTTSVSPVQWWSQISESLDLCLPVHPVNHCCWVNQNGKLAKLELDCDSVY